MMLNNKGRGRDTSGISVRKRASTPLERAEALYEELVGWYGEGDDREIRAASKLLMVALLKLKEHGGFGWQGLVEDYLIMLQNDPERYQRMLDANRGEGKEKKDYAQS